MQRTRFSWICLSFAAVVALSVSFHASAHQQQEAFTTILFNSRTGNIDVMHRFYLHDAEHVAGEISRAHINAEREKKLAKKRVDIISDDDAQTAFGLYVADHFALRLEVKPESVEKLDLTYIGQEVDGKFLWVYQQIAIPASLSEASTVQLDAQQQIPILFVRHSALQEFWAEQRNVVNVEFFQEVKTLMFDKDDEWQSIKLD